MGLFSTSSGDVRRLLTEVEAALLRELAREHEHLAWAHFKKRLRPVAFRLVDVQVLGRWISDERTIEMSRELCVQQPWGVVLEVLKHEMAHQYVEEVLGVRDQTAHGPAFRDVCARLGIDARASGVPAADATRSQDEERVLARIAKLLALAASDSEHEAQSAMNAAQRLMLKYNLELAATHARRDYAFRHLGRPRKRVFEAERLLAVILQEHFFVEVIWVPVYLAQEGRRASVLEACGTPANLDMADYAHGFLLQAADRLFTEHRRRHGTPGRERQSFAAGVMAGFYGKLNDERRAQQQEGLVWVGDADLSEFYRRRHPRVHVARFASGGTSGARELGREAGRSLVLHRPVGAGSSGGGARLLGPRR
jgi:predicted SprT family Zn-dependent metalloprotease